MKLLISPAKRMRVDYDFLEPKTLPVFLKQTEQLKAYIQALPLTQLQTLLHCNQQIALQSFNDYQNMDLYHCLTPALLSFDGIQYQYMAPQVFNYDCFDYVAQHVRILSGFYGVLRPFDGVTPYRLEMQTRLQTSFCRNLYDFWGKRIYNHLALEDKVLINLASAEYSRVISRYLTSEVAMITCTFGELIDGKIKEKGVHVKMARGEMVRFLAEHQYTCPEHIKRFDRLNYQFNSKLSSKTNYIFLR